MPTGIAKIVSIIVAALLIIYGLFSVPVDVLSNSISGLIGDIVMFILGFYILRWATKE